jgi:hypothetical protein
MAASSFSKSAAKLRKESARAGGFSRPGWTFDGSGTSVSAEIEAMAWSICGRSLVSWPTRSPSAFIMRSCFLERGGVLRRCFLHLHRKFEFALQCRRAATFTRGSGFTVSGWRRVWPLTVNAIA